MPKFKKQNTANKKKKQPIKKKEYTPFPPAQTPSKVDLAIESGEYFLKESEKKKRAMQKKMVALMDGVVYVVVGCRVWSRWWRCFDLFLFQLFCFIHFCFVLFQ